MGEHLFEYSLLRELTNLFKLPTRVTLPSPLNKVCVHELREKFVFIASTQTGSGSRVHDSPEPEAKAEKVPFKEQVIGEISKMFSR